MFEVYIARESLTRAPYSMMSRIEIYNNIYNVNSYPSTSESELVRKVTDTPGKTAQTKPSLQVQGVEGKEMPMVSVRVVVGLGLERRRLDSTQIRSLCEIRTRGIELGRIAL